MKKSFFLIFAALTAALAAAGAEKQLFAHYMGGEPAGASLYRVRERNRYRHDRPGYADAMGGLLANFAWTPPGRELPLRAALELDIRRAIRAGFDGFAVDAWAGAQAERNLDLMFEIVETGKLPFSLTICLDPNCHPKNGGKLLEPFAASLGRLLDKHGKSPALARRNGKILIFTYQGRGILRTPELLNLPEGPARWQRISDEWNKLRERAGVPIHLYYDFDLDFNHLKNHPDRLSACAKWAADNFDAVGGFTGMEERWSHNDKLVEILKSGRAEWSQPIIAQYSPAVGGGGRLVGPGLDVLRENFRRAAANGSTLLHAVTWNDYVENTALAPGYHTGYTLALLHARFARDWRDGALPAPGQDRVHLVYFRYRPDAPIFPFYRRFDVPAVLEVVTDLTAPAELEVPGYGRCHAPAGLSHRQFPLRVGALSATVRRNGRTVAAVTAPDRVTDRPYRNDFTLSAASSQDTAEWKLDFPDDPFFRYTEYADTNRNGLPDWFERYYGVSAPDDDPDQDGVSNRDEWRRSSDPRTPEPQYRDGFAWNFAGVRNRKLSFNPDPDRYGKRVWSYRFDLHGKTSICPHTAPERMQHIAPYRNAQFRHYQASSIRHLPEGGLRFAAKLDTAPVLRWTAPVAGAVAIRGNFHASPERHTRKMGGTVIHLTHNGHTVFKKPLRPDEKFAWPGVSVTVATGDTLDLTAIGTDNDCGFDLTDFAITLEKK